MTWKRILREVKNSGFRSTNDYKRLWIFWIGIVPINTFSYKNSDTPVYGWKKSCNVVPYLLNFRCVSDSVLYCHADMWHTSILVGGVCWSVSWRWRNERCGATVSHPQGSWLFCIDDGILGVCLLRHSSGMDSLLYLKHVL